MNISSFVKAECANLIYGECWCLEPTGNTKCLVMRGERCDYFEKAVLPIAGQPSPEGHKGLAESRSVASDEYTWKHKIASTGKLCVMCGATVPRGTKYCERCKASRRSKARRNKKTDADTPQACDVAPG